MVAHFRPNVREVIKHWDASHIARWNVVWLTIINKLSTVILMWSSDSDVSEVSHFKDNGGYGQFRFLILSNA